MGSVLGGAQQGLLLLDLLVEIILSLLVALGLVFQFVCQLCNLKTHIQYIKNKQQNALYDRDLWQRMSLHLRTCPCNAWFFSLSWLSTAVSPSPAWILAHRSSLSASSWLTMSLLFCSSASRFWIFWSLSPIWRRTCSRSFCSTNHKSLCRLCNTSPTDFPLSAVPGPPGVCR